MTLVVGEGSRGISGRSTRESLHKLHEEVRGEGGVKFYILGLDLVDLTAVLGRAKLRVAKFKGGNVSIFQKIHVIHLFYLSGASSHLLFQVPNRELVLMLDSLYIRQVMHY